ncbi:Uncharacterised protein [Cedecea neteri]|uniref:Bacteriophage protein n=1 Tax=Cedecea neteri TaxID=158822 RepID=A0A2X3IY95_9ENTR|nr:Uncharacterised protein [Cedecea neteri]
MEITLKAVNYRIGKLGVFEQLSVARKLLPVLAGIVGDFRSLQGKEGGNALETVLPKIARTLADLSDEDCNTILYPCLSVVTREHMKGWVPVFSQGALSFDDIDLMTLLQLVARVVADSLGNFLQELPGSDCPARRRPDAGDAAGRGRLHSSPGGSLRSQLAGSKKRRGGSLRHCADERLSRDAGR